MNLITESGTQLGGIPPEVARRFLFQGSKLVGGNPPRDPRPVPPGRRVRVLAIVHGWFPHLAAGSERMMQHLLDALPKDEFEVEVLSFGAGEADSTTEAFYEYEGTPVHRGMTLARPFDPDVLIFHHGPAARVLPSYYEEFPHAWVISVYHNDRYDIQDIKDAGADIEVFNTQWVKKSIRGKGVVVHPPLERYRHEVPQTGDSVTLVNLQKNKGVHLFSDLACLMKDVPFLGVTGTHGEQLIQESYNNITVHPVTQDMREVWGRTRVLLMPSGYESYGMVAAEACLNGIPVIANPTPGLVECLDYAGLFIPREDVTGYEKALRLLLTDENHYRERSSLAALRGRELEAQSQRELSRFTNRVRRMVRGCPSREV